MRPLQTSRATIGVVADVDDQALRQVASARTNGEVGLFLVKIIRAVCAFFVVAGLLGLALAGLDAIFGIMGDDYGWPLILEPYSAADDTTQFRHGSAGEYALQTGAVVLGALIVGSLAHRFIDNREYG